MADMINNFGVSRASRLVSTSLASILLLLAVLPIVALGGNEANPDAVELAPLPMPVEFKSDMDIPVAFDSTTTVVVD